MELRFVEGNWEHGKFKLQWRGPCPIKGEEYPWKDVPCVKEEPKKWCKHIEAGDFGKGFEFAFGRMQAIPSCWTVCPICGAKRPT